MNGSTALVVGGRQGHAHPDSHVFTRREAFALGIHVSFRRRVHYCNEPKTDSGNRLVATIADTTALFGPLNEDEKWNSDWVIASEPPVLQRQVRAFSSLRAGLYCPLTWRNSFRRRAALRLGAAASRLGPRHMAPCLCQSGTWAPPGLSS